MGESCLFQHPSIFFSTKDYHVCDSMPLSPQGHLSLPRWRTKLHRPFWEAQRGCYPLWESQHTLPWSLICSFFWWDHRRENASESQFLTQLVPLWKLGVHHRWLSLASVCAGFRKHVTNSLSSSYISTYFLPPTALPCLCHLATWGSIDRRRKWNFQRLAPWKGLHSLS